MSTRDQIIEGAARAFWVMAYADHVEDFENSRGGYPEAEWAGRFCPAFLFVCDDCPDGSEDCSHLCRDFGTHARPGPQQDWMDFAPPTGEAALEKARELVRRVETDNPGVWMVEWGLGAWFVCRYSTIPDASDFGHYLAMEAMGRGVSWEDDHEPHGLRVPHMEFYV